MKVDPALLAEFNAGVAKARNAYVPDHVQNADDCRLPGCTLPAVARHGLCRAHRRELGHAHPAVIERLADA